MNLDRPLSNLFVCICVVVKHQSQTDNCPNSKLEFRQERSKGPTVMVTDSQESVSLSLQHASCDFL